MPRGLRIGLGLAGAVLALAAPALALHKETPSAVRLTTGTDKTHPSTRSWGSLFAFSAAEDITASGATGRQVYVFNLFNYDCQKGLIPPGQQNPNTPCPDPPSPYVRQITSGPGAPDDPTVSFPADNQGTIKLVAFDADGAFAGGQGPGVGHRQIFIRDALHDATIRLTDAADGDSVRPTLSGLGNVMAFESAAALVGPANGVSQVFAYVMPGLGRPSLLQLTHGLAPSRRPMLNATGTLCAFESTADLLGDGHDTGVAQIFWYDLLRNALAQLTHGNAPSHHPYLTERFGTIFFDSSATNLAGTSGGPGVQVYSAKAQIGVSAASRRFTQQTAGPGDCTWPAVEPRAIRAAFICTGDLLQNGTAGNRLFAQRVRRKGAGPSLYQITGRGDVAGPVGFSLGLWLPMLATTDDLTGAGVCAYHQLHIVDYFTGHWHAATAPGELPSEPPPASPTAGCQPQLP